eukprot:2769730-Rhodomonas_salina.1
MNPGNRLAQYTAQRCHSAYCTTQCNRSHQGTRCRTNNAHGGKNDSRTNGMPPLSTCSRCWAVDAYAPSRPGTPTRTERRRKMSTRA